MADEARPSLIVGLGNPGPEYEWTRHNVGRRAVEALLVRLGVPLPPLGAVSKAALAGQPVFLLRPATYMNVSGLPVRRAVQDLGLDSGSVLVVHDDIDLPAGALRLKVGGGDGGHRGLRSIREALGQPGFARLRIGVGRPGADFPGTVADFVLEAVPLADRPVLESSVDRSVEAIMLCAESGLAAAMNVMNQRLER